VVIILDLMVVFFSFFAFLWKSNAIPVLESLVVGVVKRGRTKGQKNLLIKVIFPNYDMLPSTPKTCYSIIVLSTVKEYKYVSPEAFVLQKGLR
jgi:hypothetical protein